MNVRSILIAIVIWDWLQNIVHYHYQIIFHVCRLYRAGCLFDSLPAFLFRLYSIISLFSFVLFGFVCVWVWVCLLSRCAYAPQFDIHSSIIDISHHFGCLHFFFCVSTESIDIFSLCSECLSALKLLANIKIVPAAHICRDLRRHFFFKY